MFFITIDMNYMIDIMNRYDMTRYDMMHMIDKVNVTWYDVCMWMIESDRYVIILLKALGKDERNSKYVVKLVIIVEYRCETVLE